MTVKVVIYPNFWGQMEYFRRYPSFGKDNRYKWISNTLTTNSPRHPQVKYDLHYYKTISFAILCPDYTISSTMNEKVALLSRCRILLR